MCLQKRHGVCFEVDLTPFLENLRQMCRALSAFAVQRLESALLGIYLNVFSTPKLADAGSISAMNINVCLL